MKGNLFQIVCLAVALANMAAGAAVAQESSPIKTAEIEIRIGKFLQGTNDAASDPATPPVIGESPLQSEVVALHDPFSIETGDANSIWDITAEPPGSGSFFAVAVRHVVSAWIQLLDLWHLGHAPADITELAPVAQPEETIRVEAVEFSEVGRMILVGYGLAQPHPPAQCQFDRGSPFGDISVEGSDISVEGSDIEQGGEIAEEDRLMVVGGPKAAAALGRTLAACVPTKAPGRPYDPEAGVFRHWRGGYCARFWDLLDCWYQHQNCRGPFGSRELSRASISTVVSAIARSANGRHLIIAGDDGALHLCFRNSGRELCCMAQSPDGNWTVVKRTSEAKAGNANDAPETSATCATMETTK